ncbi:5988_t:CDS:1, partial [Cetraspora pellucida]
MSNKQADYCIECHSNRSSEDFLNEKGTKLKKCLQCRTQIRLAHSKNNEEPDIIINYLDITKTVYNFLVSLNNTNEFYECENEGLDIIFYVELSSLHNNILENNELQKENIEFEIGRHIVSLVSDGDGYSWIYRDKNQKKRSFLLIYFCNCRIELGKRQAKHPELNKQQDTFAFLECYN